VAREGELTQQRSLAVRFIQQLQLWGSFVRFSHSVFALPFALSMLGVVSRYTQVSLNQFLAILFAVVAARTAAMSFNRLVDAQIDKRNPRTADREIPTGKISYRSALLLLCLSSIIFLLASALLGAHCLILAPVVLLVLFGYSLTKRFTSLAHFVLGVALACAPGGVWYAITGVFAWLPVWMMLGVLFWVAGFDILYALQDQSFDEKASLHSIPVRLGSKRALIVARLSHIISLMFFVVFGVAAHLSVGYAIGILIFAWMLFSQHRQITADSLSKIESTFFSRNAWGSVVYFVGVMIDVLITIN